MGDSAITIIILVVIVTAVLVRILLMILSESPMALLEKDIIHDLVSTVWNLPMWI
jgi:hypothetical protein